MIYLFIFKTTFSYVDLCFSPFSHPRVNWFYLILRLDQVSSVTKVTHLLLLTPWVTLY